MRISNRKTILKLELKCGKFFFILFVFLSAFGFSQVSLSNEFFIPDIDSLLWESPVAPRLVIREKIKKIEVAQKIWQCECKNCFGVSAKKRVPTCVYTSNKRIYFYDSLGFPVKILVEEDSEPKGSFKFECLNTYDLKGCLVKSELYSTNTKNDSLILHSFNIREYNEENLLARSDVYSSRTMILLKRRIYKYNKQRCLEQLLKYFAAGTDKLDLFAEPRRFYDANNKLMHMGEGSSKTVFVYDVSGQDAGFYKTDGNRIEKKGRRVSLDAAATGTILTSSYSDPITGMRLRTRELVSAKEIKDGKFYRWNYLYYEKGLSSASCSVSDFNTELPLYSINNGWWLGRGKCAHKFIQFRRVKIPGKVFRVEFPPQSNFTEYTYLKR